jgi:hypothetical protein
VLTLSDKWASILNNKAETGMGYQIVSVHLLDGRRIDGVVVIQSALMSLGAKSAPVPFAEAEIADIVVTHDKRAAGLIS